MLDNFWFNLTYGVKHVLDINAYDHVLFLVVLTVPYLFKDWKRVFVLVSLFTAGHTMSLLMSAYGVVTFSATVVEFLIPVTIMVAAVYNVFTAGERKGNEKMGVLFFATLFFGLIHGFGFAREFRLLIGKAESKLLPLLEFALGIEFAQVIIVLVVLFLGFFIQILFKSSRRDWIMVVSAVVVGLVIPMLIK